MQQNVGPITRDLIADVTIKLCASELNAEYMLHSCPFSQHLGRGMNWIRITKQRNRFLKSDHAYDLYSEVTLSSKLFKKWGLARNQKSQMKRNFLKPKLQVIDRGKLKRDYEEGRKEMEDVPMHMSMLCGG